MKPFLLIAVLILLSSPIACMGAGADQTPAEADSALQPLLLVIVFDPTVLEKEQEDNLTRMLEGLEEFTATGFREGGRMIIFEVDRDMIHAYPVLDRKIELVDTPNRYGLLKQQSTKLVDEMRQVMVSSWQRAHGDSEINRLNSCILSSLYRAGEYAELAVRSHLLVFSDLLEACDDGGRTVNFEENLDAPVSWAQEEPPEIGAFDQVTVVQFPSRKLDSRADYQKARDIWSQVLDRAGLEKDQYTIQRRALGGS
jgi:hypothetical protein